MSCVINERTRMYEDRDECMRECSRVE